MPPRQYFHLDPLTWLWRLDCILGWQEQSGLRSHYCELALVAALSREPWFRPFNARGRLADRQLWYDHFRRRYNADVHIWHSWGECNYKGGRCTKLEGISFVEGSLWLIERLCGATIRQVPLRNWLQLWENASRILNERLAAVAIAVVKRA